MPPKRQRSDIASSSRTARRELTPHEINKYDLVFRDKAQKDVYDRLFKRGIQSTRYLDFEVLNRFQLLEDVQWLFQRLGWNNLWDVKWPTFEKYTLEFLSSLKVELIRSTSGDEGTVEFRLNGREISLNLQQFNEIYNFPINGARGVPAEFNATLFWREISSESNYNARRSKSSTIVNPIFRYMQRAMANTIFARDDSQGVARIAELLVLWAAVNNVQIDTGYYLAQQFATVASRNRGPIVIGGMIQPLLDHFRCSTRDLVQVEGPRSLDLFFCVRTHMFEEHGAVWVIKQHPHITLPNRDRTTIHQKENWLFEEPPRASPSHPSSSAGPSTSNPLLLLTYRDAPSRPPPPYAGDPFDMLGIHTRLGEMSQRIMNIAIRQEEYLQHL